VGIKSKFMPIGVDLNKYNSRVKPLNIPNLRNKFVFGIFGTWNKRKGIKEIIRAFCKAFTSEDCVVLFCFCKYGTRPYDEDIEVYSDARKKEDEDKWNIKFEFDRYTKEFDKENLPHIVLFDIPVQEDIMQHMMKVANIVVGFSSGESTWLPGLESFALSIPVIQLASECCGFMDYLTDSNSLLCHEVKYIEADKELYDGTSEYYKGCKFAQGNEDELADKMKYAYKNYDKLKEQTVNNAEKVLFNRDWRQVVGSVANRIMQLR
jgi:glycosyltransferase involved in cell wall biosynthesis